jgi:hypothetical protein
MCSIDLLAQLLLFMSIAQGKPRKIEKNVRENLEQGLGRLYSYSAVSLSLVIIFSFIDSIKRLLLQLHIVELWSAVNGEDCTRCYSDY